MKFPYIFWLSEGTREHDHNKWDTGWKWVEVGELQSFNLKPDLYSVLDLTLKMISKKYEQNAVIVKLGRMEQVL